MKKFQNIFFVLTIITLLFAVTAVSAADNTDNNIGITDAQTTVDTDSGVLTQEQATASCDNVITDTKNKIIKDDKQIKTSTKTVDVNNYDELTSTINSAVQDADNDEYIINLNPGTYKITANINLNTGLYTPNIIINGNNQELTADRTNRIVYFQNGCNITINDALINNRITNQNCTFVLNKVYLNNTFTNQKDLKIINSTLNAQISNSGTLTIDDSSIATENFTYSSSNGIINTNNTNISNTLKAKNIFIGENTIDSANITTAINNYGTLTINNSYIVAITNYGNITVNNSTITKGSLYYGSYNYGKMNIIDSVVNYTIENRGNLTSINSLYNAQLTNTNNGFFDFKNSTATTNIQNRANMIFNNSTYYQISNNLGNLTLTNTILSNLSARNNCISNSGNLTLTDDVVFCDGFRIEGNGMVYYSNPQELVPYLLEYNGNYTIENMIITEFKTNRANITIRNSTINARFDNYGNLTICDDVIFGQYCTIMELGDTPIIINDTYRIVEYITYYNGNYTLENCTLNTTRTNNGNLTIRNSTINNGLINSQNGQLTILNSTINSYISNSGILAIGDDVEFGSNFDISGNGQVICNNTEKIAPYLPIYNGDILLENLTITSSKTNNGNLTIRNCTTNSVTNNGNLTVEDSIINGRYTNSGKLTIKNTTINQPITNTGTLILDDDVEFGSSFSISGKGYIITNNMTKLFPYISQFYEEATVEVGNYSKMINNYGKLTIENSTLSGMITNYQADSELTFKNSTTNTRITNRGIITYDNSTINCSIANSGTLIISDDTIIGSNFGLTGAGEVIINDTQKIADFLSTYTGNITLTNKTINTNKVNQENLTLNNCTITATITNNGRIFIDENTIFTGNGKIIGNGEIVTENITRLLPYIDVINGNHSISDVNLDKSYTFNGEVTLNNCTITNPNNSNMGTLTLNKCSIDVGEEYIFIDNLGQLIIREDTTINGQINNIGGQTSYTDAPKTHIITNRTVTYYFDGTNGGHLSSIVNPGDTLDFQGRISGIANLNTLCVNKPVNIISSTQDAFIDLNTTNGDLSGSNVGSTFTINKDGAYTNVTGIYFHNTQLWLYNTNHVILDNISAVVEDQRVGNGVGQTSIRANSSYITVKNSYFYTKNNGGSSTLVLAWADYCNLINNTIKVEGNVGNMIYLTTYNVEIPRNITYNSHNKIINNTLTGPDEEAGICYGIALSGTDNLVDGNTINYSGAGITEQWGSGSGSGEGSSEFAIIDNIICNNKLYGGCGISKVHGIIYNNYMEGNLSAHSTAYNNTAQSAQIVSSSIEFYNNTINGPLTIYDNIHDIKIYDNNLNGNITIPQRSTNITLTNNNITGSIKVDGQNNNIINNTIKTTDKYTITGNKLGSINNTITDNYLEAKTLTGDKSVNINKESNTIENNMPYEKILKVDTTEFTIGETSNITASIYYGKEILTNITKGKITFKVNGKTLKDSSGKVIYAKVVNGRATIENYLVPDTWNKDNLTIEAVYSGSVQCDQLRSDKTPITITKAQPTFTTENITTTVGATINLTAIITDGNKVINTGKVVFKINGKTLKDTNGKLIYVPIKDNKVNIEYTLPDTYKAKNYTITATLISPDYDRLEDSKTLSITT